MKSVKVSICSCCRLLPSRPGQRYCSECNAQAQAQFHVRRTHERASLETALASFTGFNLATKRHYEAQFGARRHLVAVAEPGDQFQDCAGVVIGFKPNDVVVFLTDEQLQIDVPISRLCVDELRSKRS